MVVDVHPAGVADLPVDHDYLPVVPIVELGSHVQDVHPRIGELDDLHASLPHRVVVGRGDREIGDVLVQETHLDTFLGLLHQQFLDRLAALVVAEVEILDMDRLLGRQYVLAQQVELPRAARDDLYVVARGHGRVSLRSHQPCQRTELLTDSGLVVMPEQDSVEFRGGPGLEEVLVPLMPAVEDPVVPVVDTEHEVKYQADHGKHGYDKQPCEFPSGVPGVHQDHYEDTENQEKVQNCKNPLHDYVFKPTCL